MNSDSKIFTIKDLQTRVGFWRTLGERIVFTNGCFDIIHEGHIHLLTTCCNTGGRVIVGLNSDKSVSKLKGKHRPVNGQKSRAIVLSALEAVDAVIIFNEDNPLKLIRSIRPDLLIKGSDWKKDNIVGADFVESYGGKVMTVPYLKGFSTSDIIARSKK